MGLFENLGRKVEEFKQQAQEVSESRAIGECADCGKVLYTEHDECPECGSADLRSRQPEGEEPDSEPEPEPDADEADSDAAEPRSNADESEKGDSEPSE
ncbi:MAG: hypothetical protein ABEJ40_00500 [Haloarculaceae archaeon]